MSKQWTYVIIIVAGLVLGAVALVRFAPVPDGAEVGDRAPDFTAMNLSTGKPVTLRGDFKGTVTLVNIWATWCEPCRAEMPAIEALYRQLAPHGLRIASVSVDKGAAADVMAFGKEFGLTFPLLQDKSGDIQGIYQTTGVPESFLLDRNGVIIRKIIGEHPWNSAANQKIIAELLGVAMPGAANAPAAADTGARGPGA